MRLAVSVREHHSRGVARFVRPVDRARRGRSERRRDGLATRWATAIGFDRTWLYLDDARIAAPLTAIGMSNVSYTSVGSSAARIYSPSRHSPATRRNRVSSFRSAEKSGFCGSSRCLPRGRWASAERPRHPAQESSRARASSSSPVDASHAPGREHRLSARGLGRSRLQRRDRDLDAGPTAWRRWRLGAGGVLAGHPACSPRSDDPRASTSSPKVAIRSTS